MKIQEITSGLVKAFNRVLLVNECGGDIKFAYRFDNASPESGYSIAIPQLDLTHNPYAILALREMECFTTDELELLKAKDPRLDMARMNSRLLVHKDIIDKYGDQQVRDCLSRSMRYCLETGADFVDMAAWLSVPDYDNQFNFSRGGKLYNWLKAQRVSITAEMIRDFKYKLPWGEKQLAKCDSTKDDVLRRYRGIKNLNLTELSY